MKQTSVIIFVLAFILVSCMVGSAVGAASTIATPAVAVPTSAPTATTAPATESAVTLDTATGVLYGTLLLPAVKAAAPLVIFHAGSGATDRDGNSAGLPGKNNSLKLLAQGLASEGIASLRYDKRGVAASQAAGVSEKDLRFDHYVDDLAAWLKKMREDKRFSRVLIAGHSEGSLIGMIAANQARADGFISMAGIARSAADVLRTQIKPRLPEALWLESERVLQSLEVGKTVEDPPPALAALYRQSVQPYLISWFAKRPAVEIAKLAVPVFIVQGTTDIQVAVSEAEALKAAQPKAEIFIIEGMNHVLKTVEADRAKNTAAYSDPSLPLAAGLVTRIATFVQGKKGELK